VRAGTLSSAQRAGTVYPYPAVMIGVACFIELSGILGRYFTNFPNAHSPGIRDTVRGLAGEGLAAEDLAGYGLAGWAGSWLRARSIRSSAASTSRVDR
jgi:hypothetical protein